MPDTGYTGLQGRAALTSATTLKALHDARERHRAELDFHLSSAYDVQTKRLMSEAERTIGAHARFAI